MSYVIQNARNTSRQSHVINHLSSIDPLCDAEREKIASRVHKLSAKEHPPTQGEFDETSFNATVSSHKTQIVLVIKRDLSEYRHNESNELVLT